MIKKLKPVFDFFRSLRLHAFFYTLIIATVPCWILTVVLLSSFDQRSYNERVAILESYGTKLANQIASGGQVTADSIQSVNAEITAFADLYEGRVVVVNEYLKVLYDSYGLEGGKTLISEETIRTFRGTNSTYRNKGRHYVELTLPVNHPGTHAIIGVMILSFSMMDHDQVYARMQNIASMIIWVISLFAILLGIGYALLVTLPINRLTRTINQMRENPGDPVPRTRGYSELEHTAEAFQAFLERMRVLEGSRQEFVSNVSHELKTPMTSMKVLADSLLAEENVPNEMYREFLQDINNEIERENNIINDLLSLVRLDRTSAEMNISQVNLNEMVEQILKRLNPIAMRNHVELIFESFRPVTAQIDEVKLTLALSNLIENAIKYNVPDGWVRVSLNADTRFFFVKVADCGIGIPEESQEQIFERFYRVDKARSRGTGGSGLGLSITKNIITMHHGEIRVYSKENEGTTFTVRIPLVQPARVAAAEGGEHA